PWRAASLSVGPDATETRRFVHGGVATAPRERFASPGPPAGKLSLTPALVGIAVASSSPRKKEAFMAIATASLDFDRYGRTTKPSPVSPELAALQGCQFFNGAAATALQSLA